MASAFLGKYVSITAVDLIQWKKLYLQNFMNLIQWKPDLILYRSIRIITVASYPGSSPEIQGESLEDLITCPMT